MYLNVLTAFVDMTKYLSMPCHEQQAGTIIVSLIYLKTEMFSREYTNL